MLENNKFGGLWTTSEIDGYGIVETACHQLEFHRGSYEKISITLLIFFIT